MQRHQRLVFHDDIGIAVLAFVLELAHANDRNQAGGNGCAHALVHGLIGFAKVLAAFAVANHHIFYAAGLEHIRAQLASVSAAGGKVHVLRAKMNVAASRSFLHSGKIRSGHAHHHVAISVLYALGQRAYQLAGLFGGLVHFPVTGNNGLTHLYATSFFSISQSLRRLTRRPAQRFDQLISRPGPQRRAEPCPPDIPGKRRRRWRCGSSSRQGPSAPQPRRNRRRR